MKQKQCSKCFKVFPATTEFFYKHSNSKGSQFLFCMCKTCKIRVQSKYPIGLSLEARHLRRRERWAKYRRENKDEIRRRDKKAGRYTYKNLSPNRRFRMIISSAINLSLKG